MLKTNAKKVREAVRAYVLRNARDWNEEGFSDFREAARFIWSDFLRVTKEDKYYTRMNPQAAFEDWSRGLPCGCFDFWLYCGADNPVELVGDMLEQTSAERAKYSDEQAAKLLLRLIYSEVTKAL